MIRLVFSIGSEWVRVSLLTWICVMALTLHWINGVQAEDAESMGSWSRFRGPNGTGVSSQTQLPDSLDPSASASWRVPIPKGVSSPILSDDALFLTSYQGEMRQVHCLGVADGQTRWTAEVRRVYDDIVYSEPFSPLIGPATPTPATDGKRLFVLFPDAGLYAYSLSGEFLWRVDLGKFQSSYGVASSPIVVDSKVIVVIDVLADSFIAALNAETGEVLWKEKRINGQSGGFSTPIVREVNEGLVEIIAAGPFELVAYQANNGQRTWWAGGITVATASVPVLTQDTVYVCDQISSPVTKNLLDGLDKNKDGRVMIAESKTVSTRRMVEWADRGWGYGDGEVTLAEWEEAHRATQGAGGLSAIRLGGTGDVTNTHRAWNYRRSAPYIPSPIYYQGILYLIKDGGLLTTIDTASGEERSSERLPGAGREYYASPVAGDGKLYLINTSGVATVVRAGEEWTVLSRFALNESCHATPAIGQGGLFVRSESFLWRFSR